MKQSVRKILLSYFGTLVVLMGLMCMSLYTTIRRSRVRTRAVTTCVTTTVAIDTSVNKLDVILSNPIVPEASNNLGNLP